MGCAFCPTLKIFFFFLVKPIFSKYFSKFLLSTPSTDITKVYIDTLLSFQSQYFKFHNFLCLSFGKVMGQGNCYIYYTCIIIIIIMVVSLVTGPFFLVCFLNQRWTPTLRFQVSHCSAFRSMCDVPSIAVFCKESIECVPGIACRFFFNYYYYYYFKTLNFCRFIVSQKFKFWTIYKVLVMSVKRNIKLWFYQCISMQQITLPKYTLKFTVK